MNDEQQPWPSAPPIEPAAPPQEVVAPVAAPGEPLPPAWAPEAPQPTKAPEPGPWRIAALALGALSIVFGILWFQAKGEADDLKAEAAAAQAEADARPDLLDVAENLDTPLREGIEFSGDADTLDLTVNLVEGDEMFWLRTLMEELGFAGATVNRIGQTRALDGTLEASGDNVEATWTYHPDSGLSIVISTT